jgi:hypothetical protein
MASRSTELGFNGVAAYGLLVAGASALASVFRHAGGIPVELTLLSSACAIGLVLLHRLLAHIHRAPVSAGSPPSAD